MRQKTKRRAGDPIQTMDYHGAMPPQMFAGGRGVPPSCSGMFQPMRLPNGAVYPSGYPMQQNGFAAPPPPQQMMPQTSQSPATNNMMPNDRVPSEPCAPDPKSVATPPYANPSPSTSATPSKNGVDAANNSPPNDPTPGSSSQSVAGDGCQLTDCLNVADDHEKTLDDLIKSNLGNELQLTDLGVAIQSQLEDLELNNLLERISDLIPGSEPNPPTSSAPPSAPTVPTSNDNSPAVQAPMSAPGAMGTPAYGQIASPASVRSNATPAPVQTVPVVPQHNSPYGAIAPTPPMNNGMPFSPPVQPVSAQQSQHQQNAAGFPMQSPQFAAAHAAAQTSAAANGYPPSHPMHQQQMQMMHQQQQHQQYLQQQQQYQMMKAQQAQAAQQHAYQQQLIMQQQRQMMMSKMQQYPQHHGYQQNGYNLPMQYPQGAMPPQTYHPHHHYPTHQYPTTGYPMG
uniref:Polyadenylate-binding protein-interacting protein 3 n=1 Tax=Steinernema glaseri TaxID=37863 RepID=A0A1I7ZTF0_9BILA